jgi:hypothetical protein
MNLVESDFEAAAQDVPDVGLPPTFAALLIGF